jgi:predicted nuclease of predicted toxin-antitoxin system
MRFLLDENLSEKLVPLLTNAGHDVKHVRQAGLAGTLDPGVLELAALENRVLISADTDFGTLLARTHATTPSFVLIRRLIGRRVPQIASVILDNLSEMEDDLLSGAVVVLGDETMRIRRLPIG